MEELDVIPYTVKLVKAEIKVIGYSSWDKLIAVGKSDGTLDIKENSKNYPLLSRITLSNSDPIEHILFINSGNFRRLFILTPFTLFEIDLMQYVVKSRIKFLSDDYATGIVKFHNQLLVSSSKGKILKYDLQTSEIAQVGCVTAINGIIICMAFNKKYKNDIFIGTYGKLCKTSMRLPGVHTEYLDSNETMITKIEFFKNILVTGDNRGHVSFWDIKNLGLIKSIKTHVDTILSLSCVADFIVASGKDPTIVLLSNKAESNEESSAWSKVHEFHGMEMTVNSIQGADGSILCGGVKGDLCIYDLHNQSLSKGLGLRYVVPDNFSGEYVKCPKNSNYFYLTKDIKGIFIYEFNPNKNKQSTSLAIQAKQEFNIEAFSISKEIDILAYSTSEETVILKLNYRLDKDGFIKLVPVRYFSTDEPNFKSEISVGNGKSLKLPAASILKFTRIDSSDVLILCPTNKTENIDSFIHIYEFTDLSKEPVLSTLPKVVSRNFNVLINRVTLSTSGNLIAFANIDGQILVYDLQKKAPVKTIGAIASQKKPIKDIKITNQIGNFAFHDDSKLFVIYTNKKVFEYMLYSQKLVSQWCYKFNDNIPLDWSEAPIPTDIVYTGKNKLLMTISRCLVKFDTTKCLPSTSTPLFVMEKKLREKFTKKNQYMIQKLNKKISNLKLLQSSMSKSSSGIAKEISRAQHKIKEYGNKLKQSNQSQSLDEIRQGQHCFTWFEFRDSLSSMKLVSENRKLICVYSDVLNKHLTKTRKRKFGMQ